MRERERASKLLIAFMADEKKKEDPTAKPAQSSKNKPELFEIEELPKANIKRLVQDKLSEFCRNNEKDDEMSIQKDALLALTQSGRNFIHYLSATANDICKESNRQTIKADDVFKALEEIEFSEFIPSLRASVNVSEGKNKKNSSNGTSNAGDAKRKAGKEPMYDSNGTSKVAKGRKKSKTAEKS